MADPDLRSESWRQVEHLLGAVFQAASSPYALLDTDFRYVAVNAAYEQAVGRAADQLLGVDTFEVFPENPGSDVDPESPLSMRRSLNAVLTTGRPDAMNLVRHDIANEVSGELQERFWNVTNTPILENGEVVLILNHPEEVTSFINERIRLRAGGTNGIEPGSPSQTRAVEEVFTAELSRLEGLNELALAMVGASNLDEVGRALVRDGVALAGASAGVLIMYDSERFETAAHSGVADESVARSASFAFDPGNEPFSDSVDGGEPLFFPDRASLLDVYPHQSQDLDANPTHQAWAVLPLRLGDRVAGAIGLIFDEPQQFHTPLRLVLYTLANLTAQAASRAQLLEEQRTALTSVEDALTPLLDPIPDVVVSHLYSAATVGDSAGGDWYDIVELDEVTSLVAIGDVANHGAVAVGEMGRVRSTVHTAAFAGHEPGAIAELADRVLSHLAATHTTAIIATLDHGPMTLTWTSAGHPHPVVLSAGGDALLLEHTNGAPLGVGVTKEYGQQQFQLSAGDTIVFYTDGLIEEPDEDIYESMERLRSGVEDLAAAGIADADFASELFRRLHPNGHHVDDIAIVTLGYRPTEG